MKWTKSASLITLMLVLSAGSALAAFSENDASGPQTDSSKMFHKLGCGVANVVTCWLEIPHQIAVEWQQTDPATGFFVGAVKGVGWVFARFTAGVYETVTFAFPTPPSYQPILEPEFVFTGAGRSPIPEQSEWDGNMTEKPDEGQKKIRTMTTKKVETR